MQEQARELGKNATQNGPPGLLSWEGNGLVCAEPKFTTFPCQRLYCVHMSCSSVGAMQWCRAILVTLRQPVKERHPITRHHNVAETFCRATRKFKDHSMQTAALQETTWRPVINFRSGSGSCVRLRVFPKMISNASEIRFGRHVRSDRRM
ncbi:hypothetical protein BDZ85DRAFT_264295 [Elsinoe ampelina]|uniref:Uncharacterized protein n=1 Tax=Elsinoe ampelina TaxID=302913 RepID=A0A6A6G7J0_9PEZI|nr:hypothetical protein BDZ85DRAFT_264295 [Elsinoe ampelina]